MAVEVEIEVEVVKVVEELVCWGLAGVWAAQWE